MKTQQKLSILYLAFLIGVLPSCAEMMGKPVYKTGHETASTHPEMSFTQAMNSFNEALKGIIKPQTKDVAISGEGITIIYDDTKNTKRYYAFNENKDLLALDIGGLEPNTYFVPTMTNGEQHGIRFKNSESAKMFTDAFYYFGRHDVKQELEKAHADCLRLSRQTPIDLILAGITADGLNLPCPGVPKAQIEIFLNERLVEWKSKGLGEWLQKSSSAQLSDLVVKMEKGILKLDLTAKELKDAADAGARQVQAPGALKMSHLLEQRKTILMDILGSVKAKSPIAKGAEVNAKKDKGETTLIEASLNGHREIVEVLLAKGADVNAKNNDGLTVLMAASFNGHREIVQALLTKGAKVNAKADNGGTALMIACEKGHREIVKALLAKGADVSAKRDDGTTALMAASVHGHREIVQALLTKGAEVNAKNNKGATALTYASERGHREIRELLLKAGAK